MASEKEPKKHEIKIEKIVSKTGRVFVLKQSDAELLMQGYDDLLTNKTDFMKDYVPLYSKLAAQYEADNPMVDEDDVPLTGPVCYLCKVHLCPQCGKCENDGTSVKHGHTLGVTCRLYGYSVIEAEGMAQYRHLLAVTQKARGYVALATANNGLTIPKPYAVVMEAEDIKGLDKGLSGMVKLFVRPCPVRPRHGFVESRTLAGKDNKSLMADIKKILTEARGEDPEAELLICPYVEADYNAVITPSRISFGSGHDGATAGRDTMTLPLVGSARPLELTDEILTKAGIRATDDPYIEAVTGAKVGGVVQITQLRAGEKLSSDFGEDYIPSPIRVLHVVKASGDLLEWERQVKHMEPDTVVFHIGGSLISHYGVHCITHRIPLMTSREPKVGELLIPTAKIELPDALAVQRGIGVGTLIPLAPNNQQYRCRAAVCMLLTVLHNAAAMGGDKGFYLGVAAVMMQKLGMSASHGEARHARGRGRLERSQVYTKALENPFRARRMLGVTYSLFKLHKWGSGYGGAKWGDCTDSVLRLDKAIRAMVHDPTAMNVVELKDALNNAVNQAHNGGWWLNKYVETQMFDKAMKQSLISLVSGAPILMEASMLDRANKAEIATALKEWREATDIMIPESVKTEDEAGKVPIEVDDPQFFVKGAKKAVTTAEPVAAKGKEDEMIPIKTKKLTIGDYLEKDQKIAETVFKKGVEKAVPSLPSVAQGTYLDNYGKPWIHVQYKPSGGGSYKSFDSEVKLPKGVTFTAWLATHKQQHQDKGSFLQSFGSTAHKYIPLTVTAKHGKLVFQEPELNITVEHAV